MNIKTLQTVFPLSKKEAVKRHLFFTFKKYLDPYSNLNTGIWEKFYLYYSLEQNKFLKKHVNQKVDNTYVKIYYDVIKFEQIKSLIKGDFNSLSLNGRLIGGVFIKDDIWKSYNTFINEILHTIYNALYKTEINKIKQENKTNHGTNPLF